MGKAEWGRGGTGVRLKSGWEIRKEVLRPPAGFRGFLLACQSPETLSQHMLVIDNPGLVPAVGGPPGQVSSMSFQS